jgi:hypothetical protein
MSYPKGYPSSDRGYFLIFRRQPTRQYRISIDLASSSQNRAAAAFRQLATDAADGAHRRLWRRRAPVNRTFHCILANPTDNPGQASMRELRIFLDTAKPGDSHAAAPPDQPIQLSQG